MRSRFVKHIQKVIDSVSAADADMADDARSLDIDQVRMAMYGNQFEKPSPLEDNLVGSISTEAYVDARLRPLLASFQRQSPCLTWQLVILKAITLVCTMVSTLLAGFGMKQWIPIAVAVGTAASGFSQHFELDSQIASVTRASAQIQRLLIYWESLGIVEKRTPKVRERLVQVGEQAIQCVILDRVRNAQALADDGQDNDQEPSNEDAVKPKK